MTQIKFVDLESQYFAYKKEIDSEVMAVLESIKYIGGPQLSLLEKELQDFCGAKHAIGCSSGTDALLLALMAAKIQPGDEVITSSFTFVSTVEMICLLGAVPIFVDIELSSGLLNPDLIEDAITPKSKAIIPVSLFGQTAAMDEINSIAAKHSLTVIEDAAQSFGAIYGAAYKEGDEGSSTTGRGSCALSSYACTSFYPAKGLGCYGDGGAVFTADEESATRIHSLLNHGQSERYEYTEIGINGRMDEIQAAILRVKLRHYPQEIIRRRQLAERYNEALQGHSSSVQPLRILPSNNSVYSQYSLYAVGKGDGGGGSGGASGVASGGASGGASNLRDDFRRQLKEAGVPTAVYYPKPLHLHKVFTKYGKDARLPLTEEAARRIFSIPVHPFLTDDEQGAIIHALQQL